MIDVISTCIEGIVNKKFELITENIDDDCLVVNTKSVLLGRAKIINYFEEIHDQYKQITFSLLNSVKDSSDTILISWAFRGVVKSNQEHVARFGTSVIHFNEEKKIRHIKSTAITA